MHPRFGTGTFTKATDNIFGVPVNMADGERTLIELDRSEVDGTVPEVMTMYSALHWIHAQGKSCPKMSFFDVARSAEGPDSYKLAVDTNGPHVYKILTAEEVKALKDDEAPKKKKTKKKPI